jgi:hypothetical protein
MLLLIVLGFKNDSMGYHAKQLRPVKNKGAKQDARRPWHQTTRAAIGVEAVIRTIYAGQQGVAGTKKKS